MACVMVFLFVPCDALFGLFLVGNGLRKSKKLAPAILKNTFGEACYGGFGFWHNNSFPNLTCKGTIFFVVMQILLIFLLFLFREMFGIAVAKVVYKYRNH